MSGKSTSANALGKLRRLAEARIEGNPPDEPEPKSAADAHRLLHELEVHQIELEMQNAELIRARDEAEAARQQLSDLYDFAPVGYFTLSEDGSIQAANLTGATLAGIERSRLVGRSFASLISLRLRPEFETFARRMFATADRQSLDSEFARPGQSPLPVSFVSHRTHGAKECRVAVADIAIRKSAEDSLKRSETLLRNLFDQLPVGVMVVDEDLTLQVVNPEAEPNLGSLNPLIGAKFDQIAGALWSRRVAERIIAHFRHTLATGDPHIDSTFRERRKDTRVMESYEWQLRRVTLSGGKPVVVAFFNNVTARRQAEKIQRRLEALTASHQKLKGEIARRLSVEKTLRAAKRELSALLKDSDRQKALLRDLSHRLFNAQEQERKHISRELHDVVVQALIGVGFQLTLIANSRGADSQSFQRNVERAQQLLKDSTGTVHSFARELRPAMIDDLGLGPALKTFLKRFSDDTGIHSKLRIDENASRVDGDNSTILYRVAQEALANVHRHAKASQVNVAVRTSANGVRMEVTDNGKGFNANIESKARKKGRLGLLGMRERVEMVGGSFRIKSDSGKSTTVLVEIPIRKAGALK